KLVIGAAPLLPAIRLAQLVSMSLPSGVTPPRPVTTTRLLPFMLIAFSLHAQATIDQQNFAGDEGSLVRGEEAYRARDILRVAEPAERGVVEHRLLELVREHIREPRRDVAGRDHVGAHVAGAELARKGLREADDPGLRGGVVRLPGVAVDADDAGDVHDRARAPSHHPARRRAARVEDAAQVRVDDLAPVLVGHTRDQTVAGEAGVVDEHVQVASLLDEPLRLL